MSAFRLPQSEPSAISKISSNSKSADLVGTKFIIVNCPGNKVPIRFEPKIEAEQIGFASSGDKFEIYKKTTGGFWKILNDKVSNVLGVVVVCYLI